MTDWLNATFVRVRRNLLPTRVLERLRRREGQAFVEYALVLTLIAVGVALLTQWGGFMGAIHASLQRVIDELNGAGT